MNTSGASKIAVWLWLLGSVLLASGLKAQNSASSLPRADFWRTDGPVYAIAETNGVVYLGGAFTSVSPNLPRLALIDAVSGFETTAFPAVNGVVLAAAPDGLGGWYLGGTFSDANGQPRANLVRVRADFSVDPVWNPGANDAVHALAVAGDVVYVGGRFSAAGGQPRYNLAALDATSGAALAWNPNVCCDFDAQNRSRVSVLLVRDGHVYVGGSFAFVDGQPRNNLALIDAFTGAALPWAANEQIPATSVSALALDGSLLYVGGQFQSMGGLPRVNLAVVQADSGVATPWNPTVDGEVRALAISGNAVFVGGSFSNIGGQARSRIGALDRSTGLTLPWSPAASGTVLQLSPAGSVIYVGGEFLSIGGAERHGLAMLDVHSGQATPWNPQSTGDSVHCLVASGSQLLAASPLPRGGKSRANLAALDTRTGVVLDWNPGADQPVFALALADDTVYAGGNFMTVRGAPRIRVAAINATNGAVLPWGTATEGPNGRVEAITVSDNTVYAAGGFTSVGTTISPGATAFDRATGSTLAWRPFANRPVRAVLASDGVVYVAGNFTSIGTQSRSGFAALDSISGAAFPWNPNAQGATGVGWTLARSGDIMYVGGSFTEIGGELRLHLAALNIVSGTATPWNPGLPSLNDSVQRISIANDVVYVTGSFNTIGGQPRRELAAVDGESAEVLDWNPDPAAPAGTLAISTLEATARAVYVGGNFNALAGRRHSYFAAFPMGGAPQILRQPVPTVAAAGQPVVLTVEASGQQPLSVQWQFNGANLPGATSTNLVFAGTQAADSGSYSVVVTNQLGYIRSTTTSLIVVAPIEITSHPANQSATPGNNVTLSVAATGSPTLLYQWKLNGAPIPGATSPTLSLANVQPSDSGRYSVLVFNGAESIESQTAEVVVGANALPFSDSFAGRMTTTSAAGSGAGFNTAATSESAQGEPIHAGKPGGRSVWYAWIAPANGIATIHTRGSNFDTLLAAYTFSFFGGLDAAGADDDSGGFQTSLVKFNAVAGTRYEIAVDGYFGRTGRIVLDWSLEATTDTLPRILVHPTGHSVDVGGNPTLLVVAENPMSLAYQWRRNGIPIPGATNVSLTIGGFQPADVGLYSVAVRNSSRTAESANAALEIGPVPDITSQDKLEDLFLPGSQGTRFIALNLGADSGQSFHNAGASAQAGEPNPCGAPGGSSRWLRLRPADSGTLMLDTLGSAIDTTLAVFTGTNVSNLTLVACDNDGAPDGVRSRVRFDATPGTDYLVSVDGINGAQGSIRLNWKLGLAPIVPASTNNHILKQGDSLTLAITPVNAIPPPTYEWRIDGQPIPGATGTSLILTNLQPNHSGTYIVVVRNSFGSVTNLTAFVTVAAPITLTSQLVPASGRFLYRVLGPVSPGALLEATTNFTNWVPLKTNTTSAPIDFLDPASSNFPARFYRVVPRP